jgi:hypothetical protein
MKTTLHIAWLFCFLAGPVCSLAMLVKGPKR